jgi:hypothetical protein
MTPFLENINNSLKLFIMNLIIILVKNTYKTTNQHDKKDHIHVL